MIIQSIYQDAIKFAAIKHNGQVVPGTDMPYLVHLSNVAMEILVAAPYTEDFDLSFAIAVALLHDTIEDTDTSMEDIATAFSISISHAVSALTKDTKLPKEERIPDSLRRIQLQPKEVWAVKLADRITNLQLAPAHWDSAKKEAYKNDAILILQMLKGGNAYLEQRLADRIGEYEKDI